jgi:hypothetical protein
MSSPAPQRDNFFSFLHEHGLPVWLIQFNGSWPSVEHLLRYQTCKTHTAVFWVRSCSFSASSRSFGGIYCLLFWIWSVKMKIARSSKTVVPTHQGVTTQMTEISETRRPQETARSGQLYPNGVMNVAQYNTDKPHVMTSVWLRNCGHDDESKNFNYNVPEQLTTASPYKFQNLRHSSPTSHRMNLQHVALSNPGHKCSPICATQSFNPLKTEVN